MMRVKGTRIRLAMALDGNGRWCYLDPKLGAMHAVAEAARNVACTGATPVAATNCLNFGNPEKPEIMRQLSDAIDGIAEACTALGTPITGGNVSLYNETLGVGIYPTPVLGVVGILDDVQKAVTSHFVAVGDELLLISTEASHDDEVSFGATEYAKEVLGALWGRPPALDLRQEAELQNFLVEAIGAGLVRSAHDCADGGLAVALAESGFRNGVGAKVDLSSKEPAMIALFGEAASRVVVSCDPRDTADIERVATQHTLRVARLGKTQADKLEIRVNGEIAVQARVSELQSAWDNALEDALGVEAMLEVTT